MSVTPFPADTPFFEHAWDLLSVSALDGRFLRVNPSWTRVLGWSEQEILDAPIDELVHPDDLNATLLALGRLAAGQRLIGFENRFRARDGRYRWLQWNEVPSLEDGWVLGVARDVTDERRERTVLRALEGVARIGSWEIDLSTQELLWSRQTHEIHETDPATYRPRLADGLSFFPPDALELLQPAVDALMTTGTPYDLELPLVTVRGRAIWVRACGRAEVRDGKPTLAFGTFEDITREREERLDLLRFKEMVDRGSDGIVELGPDGTIRYANRRVAELLGRPLADLVGSSAFDHLDVDLADPRVAALVEGETRSIELGVHTADGTGRRLQVSIRGRVGTDGAIDTVTAMVSDITELRAATDEIARREERLRSFVELAPLAIGVNDWRTGRFLAVNAALCAMTGYSPEQLLGMHYSDISPSTDPAFDRAQVAQLEQGQPYGPIDRDIVRSDGTWLTGRLNGVLLPTERDEFGVWSLIEDITEVQRLEAVKTQFVATVSHELRSPLTSIRGALSLLSRSFGEDASEEQRALAEVALRNSERLAALVDDILDIEQLAAGARPLDLAPVDLDRLAHEVAAGSLPRAVQAGIRFEVVATGPTVVVGDGSRLHQALENLVANALTFAPEHTVIDIVVEGGDDAVEVAVRDRGPGVPTAFVPRLFERFAQADASDRRREGGTGLGLSIARAIAEQHGGEVRYDAPADGGARFMLRLPSRPPT